VVLILVSVRGGSLGGVGLGLLMGCFFLGAVVFDGDKKDGAQGV
jgi:hypothetical protein